MERLKGRSGTELEDHLKGKSASTQIVYKRGLLRFLKHYDMDTETLYAQFIQDLKSTDRRDRARVGKMVTKLMIEMQEHGYSGSYALEVKKGVNAFFAANAEEVVYTEGRSVIDKSTNGKDRMTKEHLRCLLDSTGNMRNKSIVTMGKDTGLRVSDLANIRFHHVIDAIRDGRDFHTFEIDNEKTTKETGVRANPVFGPDAMKYLRLWWQERGRYGPANDYLYCTVEDKPEHTRAGKTIGGQPKGSRLSAHAMSSIVYRLVQKAGLGEANISAHSMRKFHETKLQNGGVADIRIDQMTGRAEGYKGAYDRPDEGELIGPYSKAYGELSIYETDTAELKLMEITLRGYGFTEPEIVERVELYRNAKTTKERVNLQRSFSEGQKRRDGTLKLPKRFEPEYEYDTVGSQEELIEKMNEGWEHHKDTTNGTIIIRRPLT